VNRPSHPRPRPYRDSEGVLSRFSVMGYVAVAVLIASGLINSWYLVGSFAALLGTLYGRPLLVKLSLFFGPRQTASGSSRP
jgi:copper resistance protein D